MMSPVSPPSGKPRGNIGFAQRAHMLLSSSKHRWRQPSQRHLGCWGAAFPLETELPAEFYQRALVTSETQLAAAHRPVLQCLARGRCFLPGYALYLDQSDPEQCSRVDGESISGSCLFAQTLTWSGFESFLLPPVVEMLSHSSKQ